MLNLEKHIANNKTARGVSKECLDVIIKPFSLQIYHRITVIKQATYETTSIIILISLLHLLRTLIIANLFDTLHFRNLYFYTNATHN